MTRGRAAATTHRHPQAYPARLRLTRKADFDAVFESAQRSTDRLFTVLYRPSGLPHPRLGMTAPARRVRTAVGRNRIRRLVRESFRRVTGELPGIDIVVMVKEPAAVATNAQLVASLATHWNRLGKAASRT